MNQPTTEPKPKLTDKQKETLLLLAIAIPLLALFTYAANTKPILQTNQYGYPTTLPTPPETKPQ